MHTVAVTNNSQTKLFDMLFKDTMSDGATYVSGSVKIDGTPYPAYDPQSGFPIADLAAGAAATVEFDVEVN